MPRKFCSKVFNILAEFKEPLFYLFNVYTSHFQDHGNFFLNKNKVLTVLNLIFLDGHDCN